MSVPLITCQNTPGKYRLDPEKVDILINKCPGNSWNAIHVEVYEPCLKYTTGYYLYAEIYRVF